MTVTIRDATRPSEILGRWEAGSGHADGTEKEWSLVPHVYVGFDAARDGYITVFIDPTSRGVQIEPVEWFDENYDWGYQQPMTVTAVLESERSERPRIRTPRFISMRTLDASRYAPRQSRSAWRSRREI